jgi:hypothetical protein
MPSWNPLEGVPGNDGYLYRRINGDAVKALYTELDVGTEFMEKAFVSTTRDSLIDLHTGELKFQGTPDDIYFVIKPKDKGSRAHGIEGISDFGRSEGEVLYEHSTSFRIAAKRMDKHDTHNGEKDVITLFLEEI